jgi:L-serine deaminase
MYLMTNTTNTVLNAIIDALAAAAKTGKGADDCVAHAAAVCDAPPAVVRSVARRYQSAWLAA